METNGRDRLLTGLLVLVMAQAAFSVWAWFNIDRRLNGVPVASESIGNERLVWSENVNTNNNILGEDEARRKKLEEESELKTSDLGEVMGLTNDAILKRIETDLDGSKFFLHDGKRYAVRRFQNTYKIENPFATANDLARQ